MGLENQYLIGDRHYRNIGILDIDGATPFSNDTIVEQIADPDNTNTDVTVPDNFNNFNTNNDPNANSKNWNHTGAITVAQGYPDSDKVIAGNHLMYFNEKNHHWYIMTIIQSDEAGQDPSGRHVNTYQLENICITDMNNRIPDARKINNADIKTAFENLLQSTGWSLDLQTNTNLFYNLSFDGQNSAQSYLQAMLVAFNVELDAHVEISSSGIVTKKVLSIMDHRGNQDFGIPVTYGRNVTGINRTTVFQKVITKLHVRSASGATFADINNGKDFIVDDDANEKYNPNWQTTYLEGFITSPDIENHYALLDWAKKQLSLFNHPRVNYSVNLTADFAGGLGDDVRINDRVMVPELTVDSRVIQYTFSKADHAQNQAILGEFVTVKIITPEFITQLQKRLDDAVRKAVQDVKSGLKAATVKLVTPLGANWTSMENSKVVIAKVTVNSVNITSYLSQSAFKWFKNDPVTGLHDLDFEQKHADDGYQIELDEDDIGTITCRIEGDYLKTSPELFTDPANHYTQLFEDTLRAGNDSFGDSLNQYYQYSWLDQDSNTFIMSQAYTASLVDKEPKDNHTKYHRFVNGVYKDTMILQDGNHGSSFGCRMVNGVPEIWTNHSPGGGFELIKVPYQPNKIVFNEDASITHLCKVPRFFRMSTDFVHGYVLGIAASDGEIDVVKMEDVEKGNWNPIYRRNVSDYDMTQLPGRDYLKKYHTLQSNDINFPYVIFNAGDNNNFDDRLFCCINIVTGAEVFRNIVLSGDISPSIVDPLSSTHKVPFEPEAVGFYNDHGQDFLLEGYGYHRIDSDGVERSKRGIWRINLNHRDDSKDKINYQNVDDNNVEGDEAL
ncbi:phage tail spike protein [Pediococcus argentinicus]|uniref:phage tail spike protein n=1 Tax=Pediococcus argentinicus TaxID=480391 RepID=UPI00338EE5B3